MIVSPGSPSVSRRTDASAHVIHDVERAVAQVRALDWLTRQPLQKLPRLAWSAFEDGALVGSPADLGPDETLAAFDAWTDHLRLERDPQRHRGGVTRLRAHGTVDGVQVTLHASYRPEHPPTP
ncbi:hypothetical protein ACFHW2_37300 [Actinomadura sp. LOL_016]|uniref:hypothetical protein n=1 Tax=unclassified Actinomadura TaxID=2626254 RepID=UPI003A809C72